MVVIFRGLVVYEATVMVLCTSFRRRKQHTGVNKMYVGDIPLQNDYQFLFFLSPVPLPITTFC